ncbi:hypothetical protein KY321_00030 [Candidatus Woesearchaeota archaeon]|nr:hypothetical protein [Candidatus Woesearchaeota archaeon]
MIKTPELEVICNQLRGMELEDGELIDLYKCNNASLKEGVTYSFYSYRQMLSEIHTYGCLRKLSKKFDFLKMKPLSKIKDRETKNYTFETCLHGNVEFTHKNTGISAGEFDNISKVNDYLTVFETTFRGWNKNKKNQPLRDALSPSCFYKRVQPIFEVLDKDVGYVMIVNKDTFESKNNEPVVRNFMKSNGIIIPFYTSKEDFEKRVKSLIKEYKLCLKN